MIRKNALLIAAIEVTLFVVNADYADAQSPRRIDLASTRDVDTVIVPSGDYSIHLVNRVPRFTYVIEASAAPKSVDPLPPPAFTTNGRAAVPCPKLREVSTAFGNVAKEQDIPALVAQADYALATEKNGCASLMADVKEARDQTEFADKAVYTLDDTHFLIVTVSRISADGKSTREWKRIYTTGANASWKGMYGYVFPMISGIAKGGAFADAIDYYVKAVKGRSDQFIITRSRSTNHFDAVPTINFVYTSGTEMGIEAGLFAGIGLDLSNPLLNVGYGFTYHSNVHLGFGVAARRESVLSGQYAEGDTVATNLSTAQLTSSVFRARPFVALSFRFAANPFSKGASNTTNPTQGKTPADAKGAPADTTASKKPAGGSEKL